MSVDSGPPTPLLAVEHRSRVESLPMLILLVSWGGNDGEDGNEDEDGNDGNEGEDGNEDEDGNSDEDYKGE